MEPESIDRYEILSELGRGGMATVYRARDPRFDREVAVKVLPPEYLHQPTFHERFEREAYLIASLEHPAIVPVYDFGYDQNQPYLVMRYMSGGSLSDRLRNGPISLDESGKIISRLAAALERADAMGVVHRDLKPQNILFDQYDEAYLSDFGSARIAQASVELTGDGIIGTPAYMSPEQASGDPDVDGRSDIYALGAILFEMLTGKQPYKADTPMGVAVKHITEPVPRILDVKSDLPAGCEAVISRAMAKDPQIRYPTPTDMAEDFLAIVRKDNVVALEESVPTIITASSGEGDLNPPIDLPVESTHPPSVRPAAKNNRTLLGFPAWIFLFGAGIVLVGFCGLITLGGGTLAVLSNMSNPISEGMEATSIAGTVPPLPTVPAFPTVVETQVSISSGVLFVDDFSDTNSGWDRYAEDGSSADYDQGGYRIRVNSDNAYFWANPNRNFDDVVIEVEAVKLGGPDDNDFGVICRYRDLDNFYLFLVSSDGYFSINKYSSGVFEIIDRESYTYHEAINQGNAENVLTVGCVGDRLSLSVNGKTLDEVSDAEFNGGDVGLIVGTFNEPGADILFNNFVVLSP